MKNKSRVQSIDETNRKLVTTLLGYDITLVNQRLKKAIVEAKEEIRDLENSKLLLLSALEQASKERKEAIKNEKRLQAWNERLEAELKATVVIFLITVVIHSVVLFSL